MKQAHLTVGSSINRITIIGCCGGGKSTLAKHLSKKLSIPRHDLDDLFWHEDWVLTPKEKQPAVLAPIIEDDEWIIDSNYAATLLAERFNRSDLIIHIDLPTWFCLFRISKRSILQFLNIEKSLPKRIQEAHKTKRQKTLSDLAFYRYVYRFKKRMHPKFEQALKQTQTQDKLIVLKSKRQINNFINTFH
ncbi:hypothetical protein JD969_06665 [Planctomycetota bacterium]|nr:hypothetical protein JD969_06665 [Planctomycetota bacterium]